MSMTVSRRKKNMFDSFFGYVYACEHEVDALGEEEGCLRACWAKATLAHPKKRPAHRYSKRVEHDPIPQACTRQRPNSLTAHPDQGAQAELQHACNSCQIPVFA